MAIQDRNLSVGTKLYARYKGQTHTAEVIEMDGGTAYRLADGREFKSPSAAGTAITEKACNGWAFWSVGDGAESTGPVTSPKTRPAAKVTPAPKPAAQAARTEGPACGAARERRPGCERSARRRAHGRRGCRQPVTCAECGETFPGVQAATEHYYATHGK